MAVAEAGIRQRQGVSAHLHFVRRQAWQVCVRGGGGGRRRRRRRRRRRSLVGHLRS